MVRILAGGALMRRINAEGLTLIKQWEGLRLDAYRCSAGVWTIGYGHTANVREGMRITIEQAEAILLQDLEIFENAVSQAVTVDLSDNQYAALVSWTYNVGAAAMQKSTLVRKLNAGNYASVPGELARWNKIKGEANTGLSNRRAAEAGLWARGSFVTSRDVEPSEPVKAFAAKDAGQLGGVAAAAAAIAPVLASLSGVHWAVGVAVVAGAVSLAALWLLKRRDA